ncbi:MAG: T9SS type A sorting domain-containing protein [Bacteroidia bacterium]
MKFKLLLKSFVLVCFISLNVQAQPWLKNLPKKSKEQLTFFDYQKAFYDYWAPYNVKKGIYIKDGVKKKAVGWKQFKRWEYQMEGKINHQTGEFPKESAWQIHKSFMQASPEPPTVQNANWTSLGPTTTWGGYAGIGRVNCVAFHPTDPNTFWIGAAAGGLWHTADNGTTWTCLTDDNAVLAVSDIAIPSDFATSNTIYIATGDKDSWDNNSVGVLKSTDGGLTWNNTGITYSIAAYELVTRLIIDPNDNQTILAATTNGVYKTTNGGTSWNTQLTSVSFKDLEYLPGNFSTLYGSTGDGEIYVSTDAGANWTLTYADASANRTELAVSANQPNWVYAVACDADNALYAVLKSTDAGATFNTVYSGTTLNLLGWDLDGSDFGGGQGWYDLAIEVSPTDANRVFVGGVNTWGSVDGGNTWVITTHWYGDGGTPEVHADKHFLKYHSNGTLFECNDGGIYTTADNGLTWTDKSNGLIISQMYKLGVSETVADETITGLQDNGSKLLSAGSWNDVKGGDGMECLIDYTDVNVQYATYVNGQITRTTDHWTSDIVDIEPDSAGDGAWVTPYIIDPSNNQTLYAGYADVWKTTDRGDNWTQISTMTTSDKIRSMAIAHSNTQVLYVADPYIIWKTTDGGNNWTDITGTLPTSSSSIRSIAVKNDDENTVWVTFSGYNANRVFESTDGGATWNNISTGLPNIPTSSIVQNKQSTSDVELYLGTEVGVYLKKGTANWVFYNDNLPNVTIGELEIYYDINTPQNSKLRAATYGRGLWESPVFGGIVLPAPVAGVADSSTHICSGDSAIITLTGYTGTIQWQRSVNGTSGWANVSNGSGGTTATYTTANLTSTLYYRAKVSQTGYAAVYSNVIAVAVNTTPTIALSDLTLTASPTGTSFQWFNCTNNNVPISGATAQTYTVTANGSYGVYVSQFGKACPSACTTVSTVGINNLATSKETFFVYPSPATDIITIEVSSDLIGKKYAVTDEQGKLLISGKLTSEKSTVRLNEFAAGIYIVQINNQNKKIVKK